MALARGEYERAGGLYRESLALQREVGEKRDIAECLEGLAGMAGEQGVRSGRRGYWGRRRRCGRRLVLHCRLPTALATSGPWLPCEPDWTRRPLRAHGLRAGRRQWSRPWPMPWMNTGFPKQPLRGGREQMEGVGRAAQGGPPHICTLCLSSS